jgi:hypothetical protein
MYPLILIPDKKSVRILIINRLYSMLNASASVWKICSEIQGKFCLFRDGYLRLNFVGSSAHTFHFCGLQNAFRYHGYCGDNMSVTYPVNPFIERFLNVAGHALFGFLNTNIKIISLRSIYHRNQRKLSSPETYTTKKRNTHPHSCG